MASGDRFKLLKDISKRGYRYHHPLRGHCCHYTHLASFTLPLISSLTRQWTSIIHPLTNIQAGETMMPKSQGQNLMHMFHLNETPANYSRTCAEALSSKDCKSIVSERMVRTAVKQNEGNNETMHLSQTLIFSIQMDGSMIAVE